jgi:hypothetical protein
MLRAIVLTAASTLVAAACGEARGQYSAIAAPFNNVGESYYENIGISWGASGPNWFFNNGGLGAAVPPFGGHDPGADANFGFAGRSGNTNFFFNLRAGQGSSRTFTSETPSIVVPNGGTGTLFHGQVRPFVTGIVPVVGGYPTGFAPRPSVVSPLAERLSRLQAEQALEGQAAARKAAEAEAEAQARAAANPPPPRKDDPPLVLGVGR